MDLSVNKTSRQIKRHFKNKSFHLIKINCSQFSDFAVKTREGIKNRVTFLRCFDSFFEVCGGFAVLNKEQCRLYFDKKETKKITK